MSSEADKLRSEIVALQAERDEQRTMLSQLRSQTYQIAVDNKKLIADAHDEAEKIIAVAKAEVKRIMTEASEDIE